MSFGLKAVARNWGPGIVRVEGSFTVSASAIVTTGAGAIRPSRPGFALTRTTTGVYTVTLTQAFLSVAKAQVTFGPATGFGTASYPTAIPSGGFGMITEDFFTASAGNLVPDTTSKNLVIVCLTAPTGGSVAELAANYRCAFSIELCESAVNK